MKLSSKEKSNLILGLIVILLAVGYYFTNYKRSIKLELKGFVDAEREKPRQVAEEVKDTTQQ